ncbi:YihY/virulence factor BrkB family protein [Roseibium polysiphoniae]|uniref:YihY/virulence factor BrkB family protein n=1 Tax=Roseibium polysiphoniae TaxID=2571221 RepID=UPI00329897AD
MSGKSQPSAFHSEVVSSSLDDDATRGRHASSLRGIPARGWIDIGLRVFGHLQKDQIGLVAAGSAFFIILSIVPALAAFVSLYGLLTDPSSLARQIDQLDGLIPASVLDIIRGELERLISSPGKSLGLSFLFSLALAIWSSNKGVSALFQAMNVAYNEKESRGFFHLKALTLLFTLSVMVFGLILLNAAVVIPLVFQFLGLGVIYSLLAGTFVPLVVVIMSVIGISTLYRWGPSRKPAKWRWISLGSSGSALGLVCVSAGFAYYLSNFGNYGATYGSLGAVIGMMMWIYLSTYVVLLGAEVNAEIEHQTAKDTTVDPQEPRGSRDAAVADDLGDSQVPRS